MRPPNAPAEGALLPERLDEAGATSLAEHASFTSEGEDQHNPGVEAGEGDPFETDARRTAVLSHEQPSDDDSGHADAGRRGGQGTDARVGVT